MERLKLDIQRFATTGTSVTPANEDGTTFYLYWRRTSYSIENNTSTIYWALAINAAYSYYSNAVQVGAVTINGQTVYGGGTFSDISRGEHALTSGTLTIQHNQDGTKSFNTSISGWTWECSWVSKSDTFTLDTIPRYTTVSTWSVASKTETSITLNWKTADTCSQIRYGTSTSSYTTANVNSNSGTVTISGLTAGQTYTLYFMPKRKDSNLWGDGSDGTWKSLANQKTHPYPYAETMPAFTIGGNPTIGIVNPLNRTFTITVYGADNSVIYTGSNKTGTSINNILNGTTEVNKLYQSLPSAKNGKYKVKIDTSLPSSTTKESTNLYSVDETANKPVFNDFTYADINSTTTALTGDDQKVIQGYSNIQATISVANKATAQNYATMDRYDLIIQGNATQSASYSDSEDVTIVVNNANSGSIKVNAVDSRNIPKEVPKTAELIPYTNIQRGNISVTRAGNVGEATTLAFNGTLWEGDFGAVTNTITSVQYRYKSTASGSQWSAYASLTPPTPSGNSYSFSGLIAGDEGNTGFSVDNSFNIEVVVSDRLSSITFTAILGTGIPHIAVADNGIAIKQPYDTSDDSVLQVNGKTHLKGNTSIGGTISSTGNGSIGGTLTIGSFTKNTTDTWIPVIKSGELQYTLRKIVSSKTHTDYNNNQDYLATMSFLSYWNGAYNSSNASNLTYAHQGTIQCKPTSLYDNGTGSAGNVALSQTAANFTFLQIFYYIKSSGNINYGSTCVFSPNGKRVGLVMTQSNSGSLVLGSCIKTISGTNITNVQNGTHNSWGGPAASNEIFVYKVFGWK